MKTKNLSEIVEKLKLFEYSLNNSFIILENMAYFSCKDLANYLDNKTISFLDYLRTTKNLTILKKNKP